MALRGASHLDPAQAGATNCLGIRRRLPGLKTFCLF